MHWSPPHRSGHGVELVAAWLATLALGLARAAEPAPAPVDFVRQVRPLLADHCYACHGPDAGQRKAKLRLDVQENALAERSVIVPGKPEQSRLIERITATDALERMPPARTGKRLTPDQVELLRRWIAQGASWPAHWAFRPPTIPPLPQVKNRDWVRTEIDRFILARLERVGLAPAGEAERATLIRRLTLDLTGLPPTVAEVETFVHDTSPNAYEKLVDRLLASPHYGEKMAQDWLDLARFGDTNGYQDDATRTLWLYRDAVIASFNRNKPFDQFTIENLAGDLLPQATTEQKILSGFNRNHRYNEEGGSDPEEFLVAYAVDRTNTTASVWLGLTLGCAQCHDHKYDPVSQREYYQLYAFFNNVKGEVGVSKSPSPPILKLPTAEQQARLDQLAGSIAALDRQLKEREPRFQADFQKWLQTAPAMADPARPATLIAELLALPPDKRGEQDQKLLRQHYLDQHDPEQKRLTTELAALRKQRDAIDRAVPYTLVMEEMEPRRPAHVLKRGNFQQKGEQVAPDVPGIFPRLPDGPPNRLALARWLVHPAHPLTARVTVNRLWKQLIGTALVKTADDFGTQGELPSHPELLDWLATQLVAGGWDVKALQRRIVLSATYRQSSVIRNPQSIDPENRLLWRGGRFRLTAEEIRDGALAVSGLLARRLGGPSVHPYQPAGYFADKSSDWSWPDAAGADLHRRGLYTFWRRTTLYPSLQTFDAPSRGECVVSRPRTNTPLQALVTLNDPVFVEAARVFGERILREGGDGIDARLTFAFRTALARKPTMDELRVLRQLFEGQRERYRTDPQAAAALAGQGKYPRAPALDNAELAAWASVAGTLLNLDEMITRE